MKTATTMIIDCNYVHYFFCVRSTSAHLIPVVAAARRRGAEFLNPLPACFNIDLAPCQHVLTSIQHLASMF